MSKKKKRTQQIADAQATEAAARIDAKPGEPFPAPVAKPFVAPRWVLPAFAFAVVILGCVAYWPQLGNGFTNWDDNWLITENRWIREISVPNVVTIFNPMAPQEVREELGNEYLPLRDLSYSINYALDGYNPRGYQATNLLLHILNSLLVLLFAARLTNKPIIGGLAGLLFALHPVHVEAVSWLSSRKDLLATFFVMLSLNFYLAARLPRLGLMPSESFVQRVRQSSRLSYALALLCFMGALLSKMHAVVLPALLVLVELFRARALHTSSLVKRGAMLAPFWGVALLFTLLAMKIGQGLMREPYGDSLAATWLTATGAMYRDLQVLITGAPLQACVDYPLHRGFSAEVAGGAGFLALLLLCGAGGLWVGRRGWTDLRQIGLCLAGFGALWFLCALSPVSNFFVQIGTVYADRYLYLPSVGFCLAVAALLGIAWERSYTRPGGPLVRAVLALAVCASSVLAMWQTGQAIGAWKNSETLWQNVIAQDPRNHTAHFNLGREYHEQALSESSTARRSGLLDKALRQYSKALANPARTYRFDEARVKGAIASVLLNKGDAKAALVWLDEADQAVDVPWRPERGRNDIEAILGNYRGLALAALGRHDEALAAFRKALGKSNRYASYRINLASELARGALEDFSSDTPPPGAKIGEEDLKQAYAEIERYEKDRGRDSISIEALALIRKKEFDARLALSGKGGETSVPAELKELLKQTQDAYREAIALREKGAPNDRAMAALLLSAAEAFLPGSPGDAQAEKYLRRALSLDPSREGTRYLLARLLSERDDRDSKVEATRFLNEELQMHPEFKPARAMRAVGVLQQAVNEMAALYGKFAPEYALAHKDAHKPVWTELIHDFVSRQVFRAGLDRVVALFLDAAKWDPENKQISDILNRSTAAGGEKAIAEDIGRGLWFFGGETGRAQAEALMRTAFNLSPADGPISRFLTGIYLELAEKAVRHNDREELLKLIENMLQLSVTARKLMAVKLINMGLSIDKGEKTTNTRDAEFDWSTVEEKDRKPLVAEIMRTALLLDPESIAALNWLKEYYEKEGNLEEAIVIYTRFEKLLENKPDMLTGVRMAMAQCQFDLGQRCVKGYQEAIKKFDTARAERFSSRAIEVLLDCVSTCDRELKSSGTPAHHILSIKGLCCQRLAYLDGGRAHYWYGMAIETYERAPLDFPKELIEVRKKYAWFTEDPYRRREELKRAIEDAERNGEDAGELKDILINTENRITQTETEDLRRQGKLEEALARLAQGLSAPTPSMWRLSADIHMQISERAKAAKNPDLRDEHLVKAAQDYVRAYSDPEALIIGGRLYHRELALRMAEPGRHYAKARIALSRAVALIEDALVALPEKDTKRGKLKELLQEALDIQKEIQLLANDIYRRAEGALSQGRFEDALLLVQNALEVQNDLPQGWLLKAQAELALAHRASAEKNASEARRLAQLANESFEAVIKHDPPLVRHYLEAQLGIAEAMILLAKKRDADFWLDAAERKLLAAAADNRLRAQDEASFRARIEDLRTRAR